MKNLLIVLSLFCSTTFSAQTSKYKVLDEKDPLIGDWEWVKDPTSSPYAPVPDIDFVFLRFAAGTKTSLGAVSFDAVKGFGCPTYFLAYTNGTTIMGTISDCCVATDKGKKLNFTYEYDASADQLIIIVKDEKYYYKRKV
jgi:hypothetical protein